MSKLLLSALCILFLVSSGCSGPGSAPEGDAARLRVTLRSYRRDQRFELVSETHTSRIDYYSRPRADAARKIQSDGVMDALVGELKKQGFREYGAAGGAPSSGGQVITWGFEIQTGDSTTHWLVGQGTARQEGAKFDHCRRAFLELYNATASYQAIDNPGGKEIFDGSPRGRT